METGILTFHRSINYGSVLQAWALQHVLRNNGIESLVIDYEPEKYKLLYESNAMNAMGFKSKVKKLLEFKRSTRKQHVYFDEFRNNRLRLTKDKYYYDTAHEDYKKFNNIITGSDQIWNTSISDCDPIFFLPFDFKGHKIAYACSVNSGVPNRRFPKEWLIKWINDYSSISIREDSGVQKISYLTGRGDVVKLPDPTLLLKSDDYSELIGEKIHKEKYIFMYNMWTRTEVLQLAQKVSERLNLPVYAITNQMDLIRVFKNTQHRVKTDMKHTSPEDFVTYIFYADYVITDSFHGTAFSIVFNRPFITINSRLETGEYKNDERIKSVLNMFGLQERFVKLKEINEFDLQKRIDFETVNKTKEQLSSMAISWLINALNG